MNLEIFSETGSLPYIFATNVSVSDVDKIQLLGWNWNEKDGEGYWRHIWPREPHAQRRFLNLMGVEAEDILGYDDASPLTCEEPSPKSWKNIEVCGDDVYDAVDLLVSSRAEYSHLAGTGILLFLKDYKLKADPQSGSAEVGSTQTCNKDRLWLLGGQYQITFNRDWWMMADDNAREWALSRYLSYIGWDPEKQVLYSRLPDIVEFSSVMERYGDMSGDVAEIIAAVEAQRE